MGRSATRCCVIPIEEHRPTRLRRQEQFPLLLQFLTQRWLIDAALCRLVLVGVVSFVMIPGVFGIDEFASGDILSHGPGISVAELDPSGDSKAVGVGYLSINIQEFRLGNLFDLFTWGTARRGERRLASAVELSQ
jgi:hypothetical protein